jgi:Pyruvate/2-oxoacid:ferredoxin oxidoreductase delta subunit
MQPVATTNYIPKISDECVGCGKCKNVCPVLAISMQNNTDGRVAQVDNEVCLGCGVCVRNCPKNAIELVRREVQVITPVNSTHRFVLQAIEKGTLQNLIFDNQAFANHRAMAAVLGVILKLPPLKQVMASKQFKSIYLDKLLSRRQENNE